MDLGFIPGEINKTVIVTRWVAGEPEPSFWTHTKIKGKEQRAIIQPSLSRLRAPGVVCDGDYHLTVILGANQSVERTGGSRFAQSAFGHQRRLPPVAHAGRYAC
jgi:hypothetical protein